VYRGGGEGRLHLRRGRAIGCGRRWGAARVGVRGGEVKVQRSIEGEASLHAGQSARASLPMPARARFDRLLLPLGTILPVAQAVQRRDPALETAGNLANVGLGCVGDRYGEQ
jgi:hypothetical protein